MLDLRRRRYQRYAINKQKQRDTVLDIRCQSTAFGLSPLDGQHNSNQTASDRYFFHVMCVCLNSGHHSHNSLQPHSNSKSRPPFTHLESTTRLVRTCGILDMVVNSISRSKEPYCVCVVVKGKREKKREGKI